MKGTMRRLVRACRPERSARQSESVKGEPRFRRRPRRRLCRRILGWSAGLAGPRLRRLVRRCGWHQRRQSRLTAQDLQLLRLTLCLLRRLLRLLGLLRHTALLAMMRWRYRNSAIANRVHCAPITTAQRKKQRIRLTNGGQRSSAAKHDVRAASLVRACAVRAATFAAHRHRNFTCIKEISMPQAFLRSPREQGAFARRPSAPSIDDATTRQPASRSRRTARKKIFHRRLDWAMRGPKIASRRANQRQVIRGARRFADSLSASENVATPPSRPILTRRACA
jgi:hypothetical protein